MLVCCYKQTEQLIAGDCSNFSGISQWKCESLSRIIVLWQKNIEGCMFWDEIRHNLKNTNKILNYVNVVTMATDFADWEGLCDDNLLLFTIL